MKFLKYILFILLALPTVANAQSGRKSFAGVDSGTHYVRGFMRIGYASIFTTSPNYKLDINGNTFVGGQLVVNSGATEIGAVIGNSNTDRWNIGVGTGTLATNDYGFFSFGTGLTTDPALIVGKPSARFARLSGITRLQLYGTNFNSGVLLECALNGSATGDALQIGTIANSSGTGHNPTSGEVVILRLPYNAGLNSDFNPTSGAARYASLWIEPRIKQTGTASGITRGVYVGLKIDSAADYRAIEVGNNSGMGIYQSSSTISNLFRGLTGFGTTIYAQAAVHITKTNGYQQLILSTSYTPTSSADANGEVGTICWDDEYIYVRTSTGWKRTPGLSTF